MSPELCVEPAGERLLACVALMEKNIESHLKETRVFKPARAFAKNARIGSLEKYRRMYRESIRQPEKFWAREARELTWQKPWKKVLEWKAPFAKWFVGGKLNVAENCLDRHLQGPRRNKAAIIWEGEPGDKRILTYQQLHREVCRFANVLKRNKIRKGDRVIIYLPTIPEAAIAMLACARIGAVHSVVFGGFSADSIRDRIADCGATAVITADGGYRRGAIVPLKQNVDEALKGETTIKRVIVFGAPATTFTSRKAATSGGIASWNMSTRIARPSRSIASIRFTFFTPAARPENRRAFCTRPAAISSAFIRRRNTSSICAMTTSTGAPPMSAGSPGTATSSTVRSRTARRR